jgi:beta-glucanase (GH16 family)
MIPFAFLTTLSLLGYHLTFDAEMSQPSDMSQFINSFANGNTTLWNNDEAENYVQYGSPASGAYPAPYQFGTGALAINATPVPNGGLPYTSGMLETSGIFTQSSGYFEIRATTPAAPGFWPAFWMLPSAYYPEIDILEQPNNSGSSTEYWTHTSTQTDSSGGFTDTGVNVTQGYHRYGFLWTANTIQYVFDGTLIGDPHTVPPSMIGLQMYLIANLAVGAQGSWPGPPPTGASSTFGIDYIRAFSTDPTVPAVAQHPISSPDGVDTSPVLAPPTPVTPKPIGAGMDTLVLQVAEDAYLGDAHFTVSVDGRQYGTTQTATASHAFGQTQAFTIKGNFGQAKHTVAVNFLNDASGPTGDRNLYVTGASIDSTPIGSVALNELSGGPQSFAFWNKPQTAVSLGSGPDTIVLNLSEDAYSANAHYVVFVDGKQQAPVQVAAAQHAYGQAQTVTVHGKFGPAAHTLKLDFANGAVAGSTTDATNLYVGAVSYNGIPVSNSSAAFLQRGNYALQIPAQQPDSLSLNLTEDSYQGDAQADISLDGTKLGTVTVTAPNNGGAPQVVSYSGQWGGPAIGHVVTVNYINDAYAGPGQDRNLHVEGITLDGVLITPQPANLMIGGPVTFSYLAPAPGAGWTAVK